jgi:hypothetical protein
MITETQLTTLHHIAKDANFSPGKLAKKLWEYESSPKKRFGRNMRAGRIIQSLITSEYVRKFSSQFFLTEKGKEILKLSRLNAEVEL